MQPATTSFVPQMNKNLSKTTTTNLYPAEKWETVHKKKGFFDYVYSISTL